MHAQAIQTTPSAARPALRAEDILPFFFKPSRPDSSMAPSLPPEASSQELAGMQVYSWGQGEPVLMVHGWSGHAGQLRSVGVALLEAGYRVIAPDLPAHGSTPGGTTNIALLSAALGRLGEALGPVRAVVSHSMGCAVSAYSLASGKLRAERAVLLASPSDFAREIRRIGAAVGLDSAEQQRFVGLVERVVGAPTSDFEMARLGARVGLPALLLHGTRDRAVPIEEGRAVARSWPGSTWLPLEEVGHGSLLGDARAIAEVVRFIRG